MLIETITDTENWEVLKINPNYEINKEYPHDIRNKDTKHILSPGVDTRGYYYYMLNGKICTKHRSIASQWIPNCKNLPQIDHMDGDKTNNHIDNLRWVDNSMNNRNRNSTMHHEHIYVNTLPNIAVQLTNYRKYSLSDVYIDYANEKIYQFNGVRFREITLHKYENTNYYYVIYIDKGKSIHLSYNILFHKSR